MSCRMKYIDMMIKLRADVKVYCGERAHTVILEDVKHFVCGYLDASRCIEAEIQQYWVKCDRDGINLDSDEKEITFIVTATLNDGDTPNAVEFVIRPGQVNSDWTDRHEGSQHATHDDPIAAYDRAMGVI